MITAKLFAIAAAGFALLAALMRVGGYDPSLDLYFYDTYFVVEHRGVTVGAAAMCALFALLYFACLRWLRLPLMSGLSLASFLLLTIPPVLLIAEPQVLRLIFQSGSNSRLLKFVPLIFVLPPIVFLLGCLLFAVNFGWAVFHRFRAHQ